MTFSRAIPGTGGGKTKMSWWEYWIGHCWMTGWQSISMSFRCWSDLMTDNYHDYKLMWYDDPFEQCYMSFWDYLGDDETLPKEFLEGLMEMADRVIRGEEELVPMNLEKLEEWCEAMDEEG